MSTAPAIDLNDVMQFDHVVRVDADGNVHDVSDVYAPECVWEGFADGAHVESGTGWDLLDGYSGQWRYGGPIMHESEYIGGQLARDILATPGLYAAVVCSAPCDEEVGQCDRETGCECPPAGWAVAYRET